MPQCRRFFSKHPAYSALSFYIDRSFDFLLRAWKPDRTRQKTKVHVRIRDSNFRKFLPKELQVKCSAIKCDNAFCGREQFLYFVEGGPSNPTIVSSINIDTNKCHLVVI